MFFNISEKDIIFISFRASTHMKNNSKKEHTLLIFRIIFPPPYLENIYIIIISSLDILSNLILKICLENITIKTLL